MRLDKYQYDVRIGYVSELIMEGNPESLKTIMSNKDKIHRIINDYEQDYGEASITEECKLIKTFLEVGINKK